MARYLRRRLAHSLLTLLGVSVLVFVGLRVMPGDPAKMLLPEGAPQSAVVELDRQLGLHRPLPVQYLIFLHSVFRGDFGQSFQYRAPAARVVLDRVSATIDLTIAAMLLITGVGVPIGLMAAVRHRTPYDYAGMVFA